MLANSLGVFIEAPTAKTYILDLDAGGPYTVTKLSIQTRAGTATITLQRNGVAITGAGSIAVSNVMTTVTLNQPMSVDDQLALVVSASSPATDLSASIQTSYGAVNIAGDTMTGPLVLSGDATANLNPVSLQQLNAAVPVPLTVAKGGTGATTAPAALTNLGAAPIASPALTGTPTAPTAAPGTNTTQVATTGFAVAGDALRVAKAGDTMTGPLTVQALISAAANIGSADATIDLGAARTADGNAYLDMFARANPTGFDMRLLRYAGVNGGGALQMGGTGTFAIYTSGVNSLVLAGNNATFSGNYLYLNNSSGSVNAAGGPFIYADGSTFLLKAAAGNNFSFQNNAGTIGLFNVDGSGNLTISGSTATKASGTTWANPSSREIKTDIADYDTGLSAILALKPRTYRFRDDSGFGTTDTHIGLVHDETGHMPEMHRTVTIGGGGMGESGREVDALDCSAVTFALINAVKELAAKVEALEKRVNGAAKKR